jgi:hypothetical protein
LTPGKSTVDPRSPVVSVPGFLRTDSQKPGVAGDSLADAGPPRSPTASAPVASEAAKPAPPTTLQKAQEWGMVKRLLKMDIVQAALARKDQYAAVAVVSKAQLTILAIRGELRF